MSHSGGDYIVKAESDIRSVLNFSTSSTMDVYDPPTKKSRTPRDPMSHRIIEKRRRDRMNNCLADLSQLIPQHYMKQGQGRIEKTEIIEMAISHIRHLKNICIQTVKAREAAQAAEMAERFWLGYKEAMDEVMRFLVEKQNYNPAHRLCVELQNHLQEQSQQYKPVHTTSSEKVELMMNHSHSSSGVSSMTSETSSVDCGNSTSKPRLGDGGSSEAASEASSSSPSAAAAAAFSTLTQQGPDGGAPPLTPTKATPQHTLLPEEGGSGIGGGSGGVYDGVEGMCSHSPNGSVSSSSSSSSGPQNGADLSGSSSSSSSSMSAGKEKKRGGSERRDSDSASAKGSSYKFKNDIKLRFTSAASGKSEPADGDSMSVSSHESADGSEGKKTTVGSVGSGGGDSSTSSLYPTSEYSYLSGSHPSSYGSLADSALSSASAAAAAAAATQASLQPAPNERPLPDPSLSSVSLGEEEEPDSSPSPSSSSHLESKVPGFALHPRGSFYMPIVISTEQLQPYISRYDQSPANGLNICHPISIPVNFSGGHFISYQFEAGGSGSKDSGYKSESSLPGGGSGSGGGGSGDGGGDSSPALSSSSRLPSFHAGLSNPSHGHSHFHHHHHHHSAHPYANRKHKEHSPSSDQR